MARFELTSSTIPAGARTIAFEAKERLSTPYEARVWFTVPGVGALDQADPMLSRASLRVGEAADGAPEWIHGVLGELRFVRQGEDRALYVAAIRPKLWQLKYVRTSRIFTNQTLREIATTLFTEVGMEEGADFEFGLTEDVPVEEHVCQYEETSLDFFHRWAARLGWYYYFDHTGGTDKLLVVDSMGAHGPSRSSAVRYQPGDGKDRSAGEHFFKIAERRVLRSSEVRVRDYNYAMPSVGLVRREAASSVGVGEVSDYGVRGFTQSMIDRVARNRAEALRATDRVVEVEGFAHHVEAGWHIETSLHPRPALNAKYLVVSSERVGCDPDFTAAWSGALPKHVDAGDVYRVKATLLASDVQFRAAEETPWPRVDGFENATVDAASSSPYAQIDDDGRYLVSFHFDEGDKKAGKASTRVRMLQPHGGGVEGWHMPLRKGTEVVCGFLDGDPDRPVIIGVVPNAVTPSLVNASNATQNILQTGSASYLTIDDTAGGQWVNLYTPQKKSGLYLGVGRAEGGRSLTSNAAPPVPPEGPGAMKLGPFSMDLRTEAGSGRLHTGGDLNVHAFGKMQEIVKGQTNQTFLATLDFDNEGAAEEDLHATLWHHVVGSTKADYFSTLTFDVSLKTRRLYESDLSFRVQLQATYKHDAGIRVEVTGIVTETFCAGAERTVKKKSKLEVKGKYSRTITSGGQNYTVTGSRKVKIFGNYTLNVNGAFTGGFQPDDFNGTTNMVALHIGPKAEFVTGTKDETMEGLHLEVWGGAHLELTLGANVKHHKSLSLNIVGASASFVGMSVAICPLIFDLFGPDLDKNAAEVDFTMVRLSIGGSLVRPHGVTSM